MYEEPYAKVIFFESIDVVSASDSSSDSWSDDNVDGGGWT